jgi:hypothetical protein
MLGAALINRVVKTIILVLSTGVMIIGIALMAGKGTITSIPSEFRVVAGIVIFLYGLHRFVLAVMRRERTDHHEAE